MSYIPRVKLECVKYVVKVRQTTTSSCSSCAALGHSPATTNTPNLRTLQYRRFSTILQLKPSVEAKIKKWEASLGRKKKEELRSKSCENTHLDVVVEENVVKLPKRIQSSSLTTDDSGVPSRVIDKRPSPSAVVAAKNNRKLKPEQREKFAKIKRPELDRHGKEISFNKNFLGYIQTCLLLGNKIRALKSVQFYRQRHALGKGPAVKDVAIYNTLLHGFAADGNLLKVKEIYSLIVEDKIKPTPQTFAAIIECLGRSPSVKAFKRNVAKTIDTLQKEGYTLDDIFNDAVFERDQREVILAAIRASNPDFVPTIKPPQYGYVCNLLEGLNHPDPDARYISPSSGLMSMEELEYRSKEQFKNEIRGVVTIKSIERKGDEENMELFRAKLAESEEMWQEAVKTAISRKLSSLAKKIELRNQPWIMSLHPYLQVLSPEEYAEIISREIRKLAEGSETYSPCVQSLYTQLGVQVQNRYHILQKSDAGILCKIKEMYANYIDWFMNPGCDNKALNPRQKWQMLTYERSTAGPDVDVRDKDWSFPVLNGVGRFLYEIIMQDIKVDVNILKDGSKSKLLVPAFYSIFRHQGLQLKEEIKPHPILVKLFVAASRDELTFETSLVPMLCPPLPWISIRTGGYLLSAAKLVRLPHMAFQQPYRMENCGGEQLYPALDCLNQLSAVPWKINEQVLDVLIEVFNNKGDASISVPPPPSECPLAPAILPTMTKAEAYEAHKQRLLLKRRKAEMYSLWCDALYRLSLANHFRKDIFWLPHNLDFRGRVYPCPPHLTHLGADTARAILVFAKGEPLGKSGLDWLKIHCINLTGLKKRESVAARLAFANEILDVILDSADKPLTGQKWWVESDEPWQTLACCMEIRDALNSGDPESYVSHYPIHQDGSCNGLQHYAALGRDQAGAESVNLAPSEVPQDVYSAVATLVEKQRQKDAEAGSKIAQTLEGFIKRKVIKQTVMTTVYGVTRYGARHQIARQLKDMPGFPNDCIWQASTYLTTKTFESLEEMFTSAKQIQDWFTECARVIATICGQNVEWVTPLGLPVVQPYSRLVKSNTDGRNPLKVKESHSLDMYERPNVMKQKNAFPPNYIHSLDSSHMMLTSLHCERAGMTFVSVHDCFWTHPKTVETMNKICRKQFVALHSEPILEDLSKFLVEKYSYSTSDIVESNGIYHEEKSRLNDVLKAVPPKGSFDLRNVLKSIYFFS